MLFNLITENYLSSQYASVIFNAILRSPFVLVKIFSGERTLKYVSAVIYNTKIPVTRKNFSGSSTSFGDDFPAICANKMLKLNSKKGERKYSVL
jgi:hypothetical protein